MTRDFWPLDYFSSKIHSHSSDSTLTSFGILLRIRLPKNRIKAHSAVCPSPQRIRRCNMIPKNRFLLEKTVLPLKGQTILYIRGKQYYPCFYPLYKVLYCFDSSSNLIISRIWGRGFAVRWTEEVGFERGRTSRENSNMSVLCNTPRTSHLASVHEVKFVPTAKWHIS